MNSPTSGSLFRVVVIGLLAFVAFELHRIENKMPPTQAAILAAKTPEERLRLLQSVPMAVVSGQVEIEGAVELDQPVSVVISR